MHVWPEVEETAAYNLKRTLYAFTTALTFPVILNVQECSLTSMEWIPGRLRHCWMLDPLVPIAKPIRLGSMENVSVIRRGFGVSGTVNGCRRTHAHENGSCQHAYQLEYKQPKQQKPYQKQPESEQGP